MKQEALTSIQSVSQSSSRNRTTVCVHFRMERSIIATCLRHRSSGRYHKTLLNNDLHPLIADYLIDTVILLDCIDEILPSARYIGSPEDNEDVRCMYVAVTRAKNTLYMIVPKIVLKYGKA